MGKNNYCIVLCLFLLLSQMIYSQEVQDDIFYKKLDVKRQHVKCKESIFVCDTLGNTLICIYNIKNEYWGKEQKFIDSSIFTPEDVFGKGNFVINTAGQARHMMNIVDNAFTEEMAAQLNETLLMISVQINSSDGTVAGVGFMFNKGSEYEVIPIGVYKQIEDGITNNLAFEITPKGKKLNYNTLGWLQCPKGRAEESTTETEDDTTSDTGSNSGLQTDLEGESTDRGTAAGTIGTGGVIVTPTIGGQIRP